jgi:hypothetical protein
MGQSSKNVNVSEQMKTLALNSIKVLQQIKLNSPKMPILVSIKRHLMLFSSKILYKHLHKKF